MKTTLKKLSIPKPKGGYDELYVDDFVTKEELAALKDAVYKLHFDKEEVTDLHPFYVKSLEDGNIIYNSSTTSGRISYNRDKVEYSFDGTWHPLSEVENITLDNGERVYFRFLGEYLSPPDNFINEASLLQRIEKRFEVGGNIRTIMYGDHNVRIVGESELLGLFYMQNKLINAKNLLLPFDEISEKGCAYMFESCTSLVTAPSLPATILRGEISTDGCYARMFSGCTSLTTAPELPATVLATKCYEWMFNGCTSLTQASKLPATTIPMGAYRGMFSHCTSLVTAPELPALNFGENILGSYNYSRMFDGCTSLVNAPALPATKLSSTCYNYMFNGCTSLTVAPELPATTLPDGFSDGNTAVTSGCYSYMFAGTSIKKISLPAEHISNFAYMGMFSGCTSLEEVEILATSVSSITTPVSSETGNAGSLYNMFSGCTNLCNVFCNLKEIPTDATYNWLNGVAAEGKFVQSKDANWERGVSGIPEGWEVEDWHDDYFYLESLDDEGVVTLKDRFGLADAPAEYTTNCVTWQPTEADMQLNVRKGERVYIRRVSGDASFTTVNNVAIFNTETRLKIGGNVDKLMQDYTLESVTLRDYCYTGLFLNEDGVICNIVDASELILPATTLKYMCYLNMFYECTSLVNAPELPATTLAPNCYSQMFIRCSSLVNAPALPATELAERCYHYMFKDCTSLITAPELPATKLSSECYSYMFNGCTSLVNAPELPATTLAYLCYSFMFQGCKSLVTAPYLPAEIISNDSYNYMFSGCTKLSEVKCNATTVSSGNTEYWLSNVAKEGIFYQNVNAEWERGVSGIPEGWIQQVITD